MKKLVFIADIDFEASPKVRFEINKETTEEYAEAYKSKSNLPAPHLFQTVGLKHYWVADGRHRCEASRILGKKAIVCEVHSGTFRDALKFALQSNVAHGMRRTNADKRTSVESAVKEFPESTTQEIAALCCVSVGFVNTVRRDDMPGKEEKHPPQEPASDAGGNTSREEDKQNSSSKHREKSKKKKPERDEPDPNAPKTPVDTMGFPIPKVSLPYWERRHEIQDLMSAISKVRGALKCYQDNKDPWLCDLNNALSQHLTSAFLTISDRKPDVVCPYCEGKFSYTDEYGKHDCKACFKTGLMAKALFDRVPPQFRERRAKALK